MSASADGPTPPEEQPSQPLFSKQLEDWLRADTPKTLGELGSAFGEKSFAATILILMFVPALPLPTGGVSHVFEVMAAVLAAQMVAGRRSIWLPARWQERRLGVLATEKAIPVMTRWTSRLERISRRRGTGLLQRRLTQRLLGIALIATAFTALAAPPFSGLDTLPGLAAVAICMGVIVGDLALVGLGIVLEAGAVVVILTVGVAAFHWIGSIF